MSEADLAVIGRRWQERIEASHEYSVIAHDNVFRLGFSQNAIKESVYCNLQNLLKNLCYKYEGYSLKEALPGEVFENDEGEYYKLSSCHSCGLSSIGPRDVGSILKQDLSLVRGVGKVTSKRFKEQGCSNLSDLAKWRRFQASSRNVLGILDDTPHSISRFLFARKGAAHPASLLTSCLHHHELFRFVDIETLGMFGRPLFLIGLGFFKGETLYIVQFLLREIGEEAAALSAFCDLIPNNAIFVSFNGKCFDIPYISDRLAYYGLSPLPDILHYDLLHPTRRLWKNDVCDCRLTTIERHYLDCYRREDIPGALVPEWYARYLETDNPGPLIPVVEHNRQDVLTLAILLSRLQQECYERLHVS
jgi:uncharacterized protein